MTIKIKLLDVRGKPSRGSDDAAGLDVRACIDAPVTIEAHSTALIPLGFAMQLERGHGAFLLPRSGLGSKHGIVLGNLVGLVDSDFTGEVHASLWNRSLTDYVVQPGERIAQMVVVPVLMDDVEVVDELDVTSRGAGGFGSSGK